MSLVRKIAIAPWAEAKIVLLGVKTDEFRWLNNIMFALIKTILFLSIIIKLRSTRPRSDYG